MSRCISAFMVAWSLVLGALPPGQCSMLFVTHTCCENSAPATPSCCHASENERENENRRTLRFIDPRPCCPTVPQHALQTAPVNDATTVAVQLEFADAIPVASLPCDDVAEPEHIATTPDLYGHPPDTPLFLLNRTLLI
jgi:hypothetical protein